MMDFFKYIDKRPGQRRTSSEPQMVRMYAVPPLRPDLLSDESRPASPQGPPRAAPDGVQKDREAPVVVPAISLSVEGSDSDTGAPRARATSLTPMSRPRELSLGGSRKRDRSLSESGRSELSSLNTAFGALVHPSAIQQTPVVTFNFDIFLKQFFMHFFFPLSLLVTIWTPKQRLSARNHGFWRLSINWVMHSWLVPMALWIANIILIWRIYNIEDEHRYDFLVEIVASDILFGSRVFMIAMKWGLLNHSEVRRIETETDLDLVEFWHVQLQLITGWLFPPGISVVVETELITAAERENVSLPSLVFRCKRNWKIKSWKDRSMQEDSGAADDDLEVDFDEKDFVEMEAGGGLASDGSFQTSNKKFTTESFVGFCLRQHEFNLIYAVSLVLVTMIFVGSLIPFRIYVEGNDQISATHTNLALAVLSTFLLFYYMAIFMNFYAAAAFDYYRQAALLKDIGRLISYTSEVKTQLVQLKPKSKPRKMTKIIRQEPLIDVFRPNNIYVWSVARRVIQVTATFFFPPILFRHKTDFSAGIWFEISPPCGSSSLLFCCWGVELASLSHYDLCSWKPIEYFALSLRRFRANCVELFNSHHLLWHPGQLIGRGPSRVPGAVAAHRSRRFGCASHATRHRED
eukprot:TRINITY_DN1571_c0_g1_i2.p1 TRINITY_DN1571_c0_g1~~TRINITY_DN1571_c0_g1_i2.p1  ORF type:complete len:642 (+),score=130.42 TRINITY_DN1571_c0_g1_i2:33-1928(+)